MEKNTQRGMMKWAPFKSLEGQEKYIQKAIENSMITSKPILSEEQEEEINNILVSYHFQPIQVSFFQDNRIRTIEGTIDKIDVYNRCIKIGRKRIDFINLLAIKEII